MQKAFMVAAALCALGLLCAAWRCQAAEQQKPAMSLTTTAFENNGAIPVKYTCQGQDISPPLEIADVPEKAKSLALVMDDPDAPKGTWDHWIVWNIPRDTTAIAEGKEPKGVAGTNSFSKTGYRGPCPPKGPAHRYVFKLYALDTELDIKEGSRKAELEKAMKGHIVTKAQLIGKYARQ